MPRGDTNISQDPQFNSNQNQNPGMDEKPVISKAPKTEAALQAPAATPVNNTPEVKQETQATRQEPKPENRPTSVSPRPSELLSLDFKEIDKEPAQEPTVVPKEIIEVGRDELKIAPNVPTPSPIDTTLAPSLAPVRPSEVSFPGEVIEASAKQEAPAPFLPEAPKVTAKPVAQEPAIGTLSATMPVSQNQTEDIYGDDPEFLNIKPVEPSYSKQKFAEARKLDKVESSILANTNMSGAGNAINGQISSDSTMSLKDVSCGTQLAVPAFRQVGSELRNIVLSGDPTIDATRMDSDQTYASNTLVNFFANRELEVLSEKMPTPDEASVQVRTFRIHHGSGMKIHPLAAKSYNADMDGDKIKVIFDFDAAKTYKKSMDFLFGVDGDIKIDEDFFDLGFWGSASDVKTILEPIIDTSESNLTKLSELISNTYNDKDTFEKLIRHIRTIGSESGADPDGTTANIIKTIYDISADIRKTHLYYTSGFMNDSYVSPSSQEYATYDASEVYPWIENLQLGSIPANIQDYFAMINSPIGQVPNKAVQFRLGASVAKASKARKNLSVNPDSWLTDEIWSGTATELISKHMSGLTDFSDGSISLAKKIRDSVVSQVGLINGSMTRDELDLYIRQFVTAYNIESLKARAGNVEIKYDQSISYADSLPKIIDMKDKKYLKQMRTAFIDVFGNITMGVLVGDKVAARYRNTKLNDYVHENRDYAVGNFITINGIVQFIEFLADNRDSFATKFDGDLDGALGKFFDKQGNILARLLKNRPSNPNMVRDINVMTEAYFLLGKDMFYFFGLDNVDNWMKNSVTRKLVASKSPNQTGGVFYQAIAEYRLYPAREIQEKYKNATDASEKADLEYRFNVELDTLASASNTWKALIDDYRNGGNAIDELLLADNGRIEKNNQLNLFQKRSPGGFKAQIPAAIASELLANPRGIYSGNRFLSDMGHGTLLDAIRDSSGKSDAYVKDNWQRHVEEVSKAKKQNYKNIIPFLERLSEDIDTNRSVNISTASDAVSSILDKDYNDSEKSKQRAAMNAMYGAVCTQVNGGVYSDLAIADDLKSKKMPIDRFWKWGKGIAKLLSDPTFSVTVYSEDGLVRLDREALLGDKPDTDAIWNFLMANPRAAMALREATIVADEKGSTREIATSSLSNTIKTVLSNNSEGGKNRVPFNMLIDHPGFYALVSLTVRTKGMKRRQTKYDYTENIDKVIDTLRYLASSEDIKAEVEGYIEGMVSNGELDLYSGERDQRLFDDNESPYYFMVTSGQLIDKLKIDVTNYVRKLKPFATTERPKEFALLYLDDTSTVRNYFDTIQSFSAAKTELSTSMAGAESQRNALLPFLTNIPSEPCGSTTYEEVPVSEFIDRWEEFERRKTKDGTYITESSIDTIMDIAVDDVIRVEVPASCTDPICPCSRHTMYDLSTNTNYSTQTTSVSRLVTAIRTFSSEKLNLKVKTVGDDGTDSITKHKAFDESWDVEEQIVKEAYDNGGIANARLALASILQERYDKFGYDDVMNIDDYTNLAQFMVRESSNPEQPGITIVTIGELNSVVKAAISKEISLTDAQLTDTDAHNIAYQAVLDMVNRPTLSIGYVTSGIAVPRQQPFVTGILDQRSSAFNRNYELSTQLHDAIIKETGYQVYSPASIKEYAKQLAKYNKDVVKSVSKLLGYFKKENYISKYAYDFIGYISGSGSQYMKVVGPKTMWVVDETAREADVVQALHDGYSYGTTILFPKMTPSLMNAIETAGYEKDINQYTEDAWMLPFFDLRLNGPNTTGEEGAFNIGEQIVSDDEIGIIYECEVNEFNLGDSDMKGFAIMDELIKPTMTKQYTLPVSAMFGNLIAAYPDSAIEVSIPPRGEILANIIMGNNVNIDTGTLITPGSREEQQITNEIKAYIDNFNDTNKYGWLSSTAPNTVIGWIKATVDGDVRYHPIKLYPLENQAGAAQQMDINSVMFNTESQDLIIDWSYTGSIRGKQFKLFEGGNESNKSITQDVLEENRYLKNGLPVWGAVSKSSTASRRLAKTRQDSVVSLFTLSRMNPYGYNLAELDNSFPGREDLKERMLSGGIDTGEWKQILDGGPVEFISGEPVMNAFVNQISKRAIKAGVNPSNVLASRFHSDRGMMKSDIFFNYKVLFESTEADMNNIMGLLNYMMPTLCPPNIFEPSSGTLFNHELKASVPVDLGNGRTTNQWVNIFVNLHYLDDHYTDFMTTGIDVKPNSVPTMNTLLFGGNRIADPTKIKSYFRWSGVDKTSRGIIDNWMLSNTGEVPDATDTEE